MEAQGQIPDYIAKWFDFRGKSMVVTGGTGALGGAIARMLACCGASVALLGRHPEKAQPLMDALGEARGNVAAFACDVLDPDSVRRAAEAVKARFGGVDGLINAAGGNRPEATTGPGGTFFDLPVEALRWVVDLNLTGTVIPCQVFGKAMAEQGHGTILNVSSMSGLRPLTRIPAYSAAKAAVGNFTQWLAIHMATEYSPRIRVNAIAPGFFLTEQNRYLLQDEETGKWTARGQSILAHTPLSRFGNPSDLLGAALWLLSPAAGFVTGTVVAVDGGFSAACGV